MKQNNHSLLCLHCSISLNFYKVNFEGIIVEKEQMCNYILLKNEYIRKHVGTYFIDVLWNHFISIPIYSCHRCWESESFCKKGFLPCLEQRVGCLPNCMHKSSRSAVVCCLRIRPCLYLLIPPTFSMFLLSYCHGNNLCCEFTGSKFLAFKLVATSK